MNRTRITRPRYAGGIFDRLLARLGALNAESRQRTETERQAALIEYSIRHDFRDGFRRRPHGNDAQSIAIGRRHALGPMIDQELRDAEIEQLTGYAEALAEAQSAVDRRLAELTASQGSLALLRREREKREARERAQQRRSINEERSTGT